MFNSEDSLKKNDTKGHGHPFTCDICKAVCTNQFQFFEHLKVHYEGRTNSSSNATQDNTIVPHKPVNKAGIRPTTKNDSYRNNYNATPVVDAPEKVVFVCIWCNKTYKREKTYVAHLETCTKQPDPATEDKQFKIKNTKTKRARKLKLQKEEAEEFVFSEQPLSPFKLTLIKNIKNVAFSPGDDSDDYGSDPLEDKDTFKECIDDMDQDDLILDDDGTPGSASKSKKKRAIGQRQHKVLKCNECSRIFKHRNSLVYHMKSHTGERPYICQQCGKSFFATSALKAHMRLHSGEKPYQCDHCRRCFRQSGDLQYHVISIHSSIRKYQCEFCGKDFARKYSLIVHRRIHTGERNYKCEFCDKRFRASSYLQNHRKIHTGEKPHACTICLRPFKVRSDMKRHMASHNRDNKNTHKTITVSTNADQFNQVVASIGPQIDQQIAQAVRNGTQTIQVQRTQVPTQETQQILEETVITEVLSEGMPINITLTQDGCANSSLETASVATFQSVQLPEGDFIYSNGPCDVPVDTVTIYDTIMGPLYVFEHELI